MIGSWEDREKAALREYNEAKELYPDVPVLIPSGLGKWVAVGDVEDLATELGLPKFMDEESALSITDVQLVDINKGE